MFIEDYSNKELSIPTIAIPLRLLTFILELYMSFPY